MKVVLSIAGSDCSGGAGIQADLKTFEYFGVFGTSAITVMTAQNTKGVTDILPSTKSFLKSQLEAIADDFEISAVKIGMLYNKELIQTVRDFLVEKNFPVVFDPVFVSKAGSKLLQDDAIEAMKDILPLCDICTPNLFEAKEIFGYEFGESDTLKNLQNLACDVLIKNHKIERNGEFYSVDVLYAQEGEKLLFETKSLESQALHGTGCSFSSAIAANLALGQSMHKSIMTAKEFVYKGIKNSPQIGSGPHPILHNQNTQKENK